MQVSEAVDQRVERPLQVVRRLVGRDGELLASHHQPGLRQVGVVEPVRELDQDLVALDEHTLQDALHRLGHGGGDPGLIARVSPRSRRSRSSSTSDPSAASAR